MIRLLLALLLLVSGASAQTVQQSGVITPGHAACWAITGAIYDCGAPGGGVSVVGSTTTNDFVAFNASGSLIDSGINPTSTSAWSGLQNFNGGATAPTRPANDNSTFLATTAFVQGVFATNTNPFVLPQSFIGTNTNPITTDGAQVTVQNSATTALNILTPVSGGSVYDGTRSTVVIPSGSTVLNAEAFGAYVRNRSASNTPNFGNGVLYYGLITCGVSGTNCWGENLRIADTEDNAGHALTGVALAMAEYDVAIKNTATRVAGINILGASGNVQPAGADGYTCGTLNPATPSVAYWTHCLVVPDNVASVGAYFGTSAAQGTNVPSIPIQFAAWDSSGAAEHFMNLSLIPFGTNSALSILDLVRANGLFFEMTATGVAPIIGAQGSDTNIGLILSPKGSGVLTLGTGSNTITAAVATTFSAAITYGGVTLSNAVTGTGNMVLSASPTFTGTPQFGSGSGTPSHIASAQTTAPALTSCGTNPAITGTDTAGIVTMGTGSPTGCVITFNVAYSAAPYCVVTWIATPLASQSYVTAASTITLTQTATSSNKVQYVCVAQAGG